MPVGEKKVGLPELFYDLVFVYLCPAPPSWCTTPTKPITSRF